jgi:hypothetical protein
MKLLIDDLIKEYGNTIARLEKQIMELNEDVFTLKILKEKGEKYIEME